MDGPDGSGKTTFADDLAAVLRERDRPVVRISLDDFHTVRAVLYRQGRESPEGFWRDSYNYPRFRADVLEPFGPNGSRRYRAASHDRVTDAILTPEPRLAPPSAVLVVDGLFLHRDELAATWDLSLFLDVPFTEIAQRLAFRDGTNPDPDHPDIYHRSGRPPTAGCRMAATPRLNRLPAAGLNLRPSTAGQPPPRLGPQSTTSVQPRPSRSARRSAGGWQPARGPPVSKS